jgi:signal transduction histidine kinase
VLETLDALGFAAVAFAPNSSRIDAMTKAAERVLGARETWLERVHPGDGAFLEAACSAKEDAHVVFRATPDNLTFRVHQFELRWRDGAMLGIVFEPRVGEASGEPQLEALLEALPFEVWERDGDGVLIRQNACAIRNWGAKLGSTVHDMGLPKEIDAKWSDFNRRAFAGEIVRAPIDYTFGDKRTNIINIVAPVRDGDSIRGIVGVNVDITEQRRALDDLAAAQEALVKRERLAALGELAAVVAHEVRNPLAAIFNSLSTLRRQLTLESDAAILFGILEEEAGRLNRTVGDLLNYVRPLEPERRHDDLVELARDVVRQRLQSRPDDIESEVISESSLESVSTDPVLMRIALSNLVTNAVQAMPEGGKLTVTLSHAQHDGIAIAVRDTGRGIPAAVLPRVFEPFFTTRASGAGLGLAVVRRIVEAHDGHVLAESDGTRGTVFTVVLPR